MKSFKELVEASNRILEVAYFDQINNAVEAGFITPMQGIEIYEGASWKEYHNMEIWINEAIGELIKLKPLGEKTSRLGHEGMIVYNGELYSHSGRCNTKKFKELEWLEYANTNMGSASRRGLFNILKSTENDCGMDSTIYSYVLDRAISNKHCWTLVEIKFYHH